MIIIETFDRGATPTTVRARQRQRSGSTRHDRACPRGGLLRSGAGEQNALEGVYHMDERLKFIARLLDGDKMALLCRQFGISRKTGYKILNRCWAFHCDIIAEFASHSSGVRQRIFCSYSEMRRLTP